MKYFLDFDRTVFDTVAFKKAVAKRPPVLIVIGQLKDALVEFFRPSTDTSRRRHFMRTWGTFLSHGRFAFTPEELQEFLYPDAVVFLQTHDCTIVTYGVRAFITAKVVSALSAFPNLHIEYTSRKKGRTIRRLCQESKDDCTFVDDAHFQLESVAEWCPSMRIIEMRRDGNPGLGRWPVVHSFSEVV